MKLPAIKSDARRSCGAGREAYKDERLVEQPVDAVATPMAGLGTESEEC